MGTVMIVCDDRDNGREFCRSPRSVHDKQTKTRQEGGLIERALPRQLYTPIVP